MSGSARTHASAASGPPAGRVKKGRVITSSVRNGNTSKAKRNVAAQKNITGAKSRVGRQQKAYAELPSRRAFRRKCANPFDRSKARHSGSKLALAYDRRQIPFRIKHSGSGTNALQWDVEPEEMATYDPLLVYVADGLCENRHPFAFMAKQAFQDMLQAKNGPRKAVACLRGVVEGLRRGLMIKDEGVSMAVLIAVQQLSAAVRENLTPYYKYIVTQVSKRGLINKFARIVDTTLQILEQNGGENAFRQIKSKLPAYQSTVGK